jgi:hypothetical protein
MDKARASLPRDGSTKRRGGHYGWEKNWKIKKLKKPEKKNKKTGWFGFSFIDLKLKKPNPTQTGKKRSQTKKSSQTEKTESNRFEPVFVLKNRTKTGRFEPVSVFFFYNFGLVIFI